MESLEFDFYQLSRRERQVIGLYAKGYKAAEIARRLNLSVKTISTYRTRVREKLGISESTRWMDLLRAFPESAFPSTSAQSAHLV